jgi:hypothetical protein
VIFLTGVIVGSVSTLLVTKKTDKKRLADITYCSTNFSENTVLGINKIKNS